MFCNQCGAPLPEDSTLCPVCGIDNAAQLELHNAVNEALEQAAQVMEEVSAPQTAEPAAEPEPPQPVEEEAAAPSPEVPEPETAPAPEPQGKVNFVTPIYAQPRPNSAPAANEAVSNEVPSALQYFLMQLLVSLPLVGIIVSIVWALDDSGSKHRRSFAAGSILFILVKLAVHLLLLAIILGLVNLFLGQLYTAGYYSAPFGGFMLP